MHCLQLTYKKFFTSLKLYFRTFQLTVLVLHSTTLLQIMWISLLRLGYNKKKLVLVTKGPHIYLHAVEVRGQLMWYLAP